MGLARGWPVVKADWYERLSVPAPDSAAQVAAGLGGRPAACTRTERSQREKELVPREERWEGRGPRRQKSCERRAAGGPYASRWPEAVAEAERA